MTEEQINTYAKLLIVANVTLGWLDAIECTEVYRHNIKAACRSMVKALEGLDSDIKLFASHASKEEVYAVWEGQERLIEFMVGLTTGELANIGNNAVALSFTVKNQIDENENTNSRLPEIVGTDHCQQ